MICLRGDFLESRVFFAKTAQNLATKPSRENALPPVSVLKVFQKYLRRKTEFYWIFGYVMRQNIAKYKEGLRGKCNIEFNGRYLNCYYVNMHTYLTQE